MKKTRVLALLAALPGVACTDPRTPLAPDAKPIGGAARALAADGPKYIVVVRPSARDIGDKARALAQRVGGTVTQTWEVGLRGFVLAGVQEALLAALREDRDVAYVERDGVMTVSDVRTLPPPGQSNGGSWWGLDRIDQRGATLDNQYNYYFAGAGSHIYIIDTGVRGTHVEFTGRIGNGVVVCDIAQACTSANTDTYGHGTAMAGVAAGSVSGIATQATIHSVRASSTER